MIRKGLFHLLMIKTFFESNNSATRWLIKTLIKEPKLLETILISPPSEQLRKTYAEMICYGIVGLAPNEKSLYAITHTKIVSLFGDKRPITPECNLKGASYSIWFIETLYRMIPLKNYQSSWTNQIFIYFLRFAAIGTEESSFLINLGIIRLLNRFLKKQEEFASEETSKPTSSLAGYSSLLQNFYPTNHNITSRFSATFDIIAHLFCSAQLNFKTCPPTATFQFDLLLKLPKEEYDIIINEKFIVEVLKYDMNLAAIDKIALHHCWESKQGTDFWFNLIKGAIETNDIYRSDLIRPCMTILYTLLELEDSYSNTRIEESFDLMTKLLQTMHKEKIKLWLEKILSKNPRVKAHYYKKENKHTLNNIFVKSGRIII